MKDTREAMLDLYCESTESLQAWAVGIGFRVLNMFHECSTFTAVSTMLTNRPLTHTYLDQLPSSTTFADP